MWGFCYPETHIIIPNAVFFSFLITAMQNIYFYFTSLLSSPSSNASLLYFLLALKQAFSDRKCLPESHIHRSVLPENIFPDISAVALFSMHTKIFKAAETFHSNTRCSGGGGMAYVGPGCGLQAEAIEV